MKVDQRMRVVLRLKETHTQLIGSMQKLLALGEQLHIDAIALRSFLIAVPRKQFALAPYRLQFFSTNITFYDATVANPLQFTLFEQKIFGRTAEKQRESEKALTSHLCEHEFHSSTNHYGGLHATRHF